LLPFTQKIWVKIQIITQGFKNRIQIFIEHFN
jgi:hypothetical protein